ncbi:hypothetical protein B0A55_04238 [Friedmanniomyces simplex]|uniref:Uncharacterized protein n=1 Tax=Friedmanniomyces simplex TaxID=329884 RepID=A0A4U0XS33_9PEZI|nr:hypothetical protein B0A55_04238 [Friedmanniomyces simplex]
MPNYQQLAAHIDKLNRDIEHHQHSRNSWLAKRQTVLGHLQHCSNVRVPQNNLSGNNHPSSLLTRLRDEKTMWQNRLNVANNHLQDHDEILRRDRSARDNAQRQLNGKVGN